MVFRPDEKLPSNGFYVPLRKTTQATAGLDHLLLLYCIIIRWSLISKARGENELGKLIVFIVIRKSWFIDVIGPWSFLLCCTVIWSLMAKHTGNSFVLCVSGTHWLLVSRNEKLSLGVLAREILEQMRTRKPAAFSNNVLSILIWRKSLIWINSENSVVLLFSRQEMHLFWRMQFVKFSKLLEFQPAF